MAERLGWSRFQNDHELYLKASVKQLSVSTDNIQANP